MSEKMRVGASACLLGYRVRYDGGHKLEQRLIGALGRHVEYVPVCPEYECGLGVPRESMRLVGDPASPKLVTAGTGIDLTADVAAWALARVGDLSLENLSGFVFKSGSPSCGMRSVKVWDEREGAAKRGAGIFARTLMERFPTLPVEDERRLYCPAVRESFIERVSMLFRLTRARELLYIW